MKSLFLLLLGFFSLLLSLILAELGVRLVRPQPLTSSLYEQDASGLLIHRKNFSGSMSLNGRKAQYDFDDSGARVEQQPDTSLLNTAFKVVVLGDSFTFGHGVSFQDSIVGILNSEVRRVFGSNAVYLANYGVGGWGAADYVRFLEVYGDFVKPDAIFILMNGDDIGRSLRGRLYSFVRAENTLVPTPPSAETAQSKGLIRSIPFYDFLAEHSHLLNLARRAISKSRGSFNPSTTASSPQLDPKHIKGYGRALFERLFLWAGKRDVPVFIGTTCFLKKMHHHESLFQETALFMEDAPAFFQSQNVPFFDCSNSLDSRIGGDYSGLVIPGDGHPNEVGSAAIAAELIQPLIGWLEGIARPEISEQAHEHHE